jgi:hypothetical protein
MPQRRAILSSGNRVPASSWHWQRIIGARDARPLFGIARSGRKASVTAKENAVRSE